MNEQAQKELATPTEFQRRAAAIDIARGMIVAVMALDHVRIYFSSAPFDPLDLQHTTPSLFFTRWITHLCAPGFFFVAGIGAALYQRRAGALETSKFLAKRGLLLMALEILVFGIAWSFNPGWWWFGVIWALGASMVLLAGLTWSDGRALVALALLFIVATNLVWPVQPFVTETWRAIFLSGGIAHLGPAGVHLALYAILPWAALMVLGYGATPWLVGKDGVHSARAIAAGAAAIALFIALRIAGIGEPFGRGTQWNGGLSHAILSFLNVQKYPPSLHFSLLMIGLFLVILGLVDRATRAGTRLLQPLQVFGRVPFFFYLVHIFLIHGLALLCATLFRWPTEHLFWQRAAPDLSPPPGYGTGLVGVYGVWLAVLLIVYPACRWFGGLKARVRHPALPYL